MRVRAVRLGAVAAAVALLTSGCGFVLVNDARPGGPADPIRIVAPAHRTQLASVASVPVSVAIPGIQPGTLDVALMTGSRYDRYRNVTSRFTVASGSATATLGPADFEPGLSRLVVSGVPASGGGRVVRDATWSWEPGIDVSAEGCEFLGQSRCLLPFPNDWFTEADSASATGRRVHLDPDAMPANQAGTRIDPTEWNRNDGFSQGSAIIVHVPGVDLARSGAAPVTDMARSLAPDQPIVLLDTTTGERWPFFAELDANATSDATRALVIRPARNFHAGHHIVVGLRNLRRANGSLIAPSRAFEVYRDLIPTFVPEIEQRRAAMNATIGALEGDGVDRRSLHLAWDFTVASDESITGRSLHLRDDAFATIGAGAPAFTVSSVQDDVSDTIFRRVTGTVTVPKYLTGTGGPGSRFDYGGSTDPDELPTRNGTLEAAFICNIPRSATAAGADPVTPARALVYGHGLLGNATEVNAFGHAANGTNSVMCAMPWIGMSSEDVPNVVSILGDLSGFPTLVDRLQQGFLNFQFLARAMKSPSGFVTHAAFRAGTPAKPVIATGEAFFNGNSQGGILGGALTALSKEWTRAVLGVPAMNYSTLLTRSIDYDQFKPLNAAAYPDELQQALGLTFIQMLWDRGEGNGYVAHLTTDPLPGTPQHQVLLIGAFGDHQVANVATETEARSAPGMRVWQPALRAGRSPDVTPMWGIPSVPAVPYGGSVLVMWDYGTPAPPTTNTPNRAGNDPHGLGSANPLLIQQVDAFLRANGTFVDVCGGGPCVSTGGE
jgi:hypothetical protein